MVRSFTLALGVVVLAAMLILLSRFVEANDPGGVAPEKTTDCPSKTVDGKSAWYNCELTGGCKYRFEIKQYAVNCPGTNPPQKEIHVTIFVVCQLSGGNQHFELCAGSVLPITTCYNSITFEGVPITNETWGTISSNGDCTKMAHGCTDGC